MKKRKLKSNLVMMMLGVLIGLLITTITRQLSMIYIFMFIALLVLLIVGISIITNDDFDIKLIRAYERGVRSVLPLHPNCKTVTYPIKSGHLRSCSCKEKEEG